MALEKGANVPPIKVYPDKFSGHVAVVTGAAQGIGAATAHLFADQGAQVILLDLQKEKLQQAQFSIEERGGKASYGVCDITDERNIQEVVDWVISSFHKIDILANIAGIYLFHPLSNLTTEAYLLTMSVNVDACFFLTRAILPHMKKSGYGRIIHTSSSTVQEPEEGLSAYAASKAAVIGLVRATSVETAPGVTANVVMPGLIRTAHVWNSGIQPDGSHSLFERIVKKQNVKRWGRPECIYFLFHRQPGGLIHHGANLRH